MNGPEGGEQFKFLNEAQKPPVASDGAGWQGVTVSPSPKKEPPRTEVTATFVFDALRNGALGGWMVGSCASLAFDLPYWETALTSAFCGSMACVLLSTGAALLIGSRSLFATLIRFLHGLMATAFIAAFLGIIVLYIYVKVQTPKPGTNIDPPRATIN